MLGPVLFRRGYVLSYDLVWVPEPPLSRRALGLDGSVPRAVPSDLLAVALSRVLPADLGQKAVLAAVLVLAVAGAYRLAVGAARLTPSGAATASLVYVWSPFLAERLVLGHWALLLGFAALPWALEAAARGRVVAACAWTVPAAVGGGNAVLLTVPAVALLFARPQIPGRRGRRAMTATASYLAFCLVTALPWVVPTVLRPGGLASDPAGVEAFAARADGPLGTIPSLVSLGGIWNTAVVPPERRNVGLAVLALVLVAIVLVVGAPRLLRRPAGPALVAAGMIGLLLAAASGIPLVAAGVRFVVLHVPGGGVLRDSQKFLAAWVLLVALCAGCAAERAVRRLRGLSRAGGAALAVLLALTPVALLPSLAWGAAGRLRPVTFPQDWALARAAMDDDPVAGAVVVLPWGPYRRFAWNGYRVGLDPVQRITDREVIMDDDLPLRGRIVAGEDPRARDVARLLRDGEPLEARLAALGVRFVVVHAAAVGAESALTRVRGARCVRCEGDLRVFVLEPRPTPPSTGAPAAAVAVSGLLALVAACGAVVTATARGVGRPLVPDSPLSTSVA